MNKMKTTALILISAVLLAGCINLDFADKSSPSVDESQKHTGVILYTGVHLTLVRVKIDGVDYIANSRGGLVRVGPSQAVQP